MSNSTETLQTTTNLCRTHVALQPLTGVGGFVLEPALSLCNNTLQELLSPPYPWKFNRIEMPMLVTYPCRQDYQFGGAVAFTLGSTSRGAGIGLASNNAIGESGTTVTVNTLEPHGFSVGDTVYMSGNTVSSYNSTLTQNENSSVWSGGWTITAATSTSFTFTHGSSGLANSGAPGITDFGWLESATMVELNSTSPIRSTRYLRAVQELRPVWQSENPCKVCVLKDNGDGTLKVRFDGVPGSTIWGVNLVYQAKPPIKVALTDTWAPFPDEYGFLYRQMFLALCWRYINDPKQVVEYQKAEQMIIKALGKADSEASDVHIVPAEGLMPDWVGW
jgi:hypothetical protein